MQRGPTLPRSLAQSWWTQPRSERFRQIERRNLAPSLPPPTSSRTSASGHHSWRLQGALAGVRGWINRGAGRVGTGARTMSAPSAEGGAAGAGAACDGATATAQVAEGLGSGNGDGKPKQKQKQTQAWAALGSPKYMMAPMTEGGCAIPRCKDCLPPFLLFILISLSLCR